MIEPELIICFCVVAYIDSGYGDNRSKDFDHKQDAIDYARSLPTEYKPYVYKSVTMQTIHEPIEWKIK